MSVEHVVVSRKTWGMSRKDAVSHLGTYGYAVQPAVTTLTRFVLTIEQERSKDPAKATTKLKDARKLGIPIITDDEFDRCMRAQNPDAALVDLLRKTANAGALGSPPASSPKAPKKARQKVLMPIVIDSPAAENDCPFTLCL